MGCLIAVPLHICNMQATNDSGDGSARHGQNLDKKITPNYWIECFYFFSAENEKLCFISSSQQMFTQTIK